MSALTQFVQELTGTATAGRMCPWETLPPELDMGFDKLGKIDPHWVWVIRSPEGRIIASLLASSCHGSVFILRVSVLPQSPVTTLMRLFHTFINDMRALGMTGMFTVLGPTEAQLGSILRRVGGKEFGNVSVVAAPIPAREFV